MRFSSILPFHVLPTGSFFSRRNLKIFFLGLLSISLNPKHAFLFVASTLLLILVSFYVLKEEQQILNQYMLLSHHLILWQHLIPVQRQGFLNAWWFKIGITTQQYDVARIKSGFSALRQALWPWNCNGGASQVRRHDDFWGKRTTEITGWLKLWF